MANKPLVVLNVEQRAQGRVATITVDNPDKRNRLDVEGKQQLIDALAGLARDDELRVAVLTGAGDKSFISGSNIAQMAHFDAQPGVNCSIRFHDQ